MFDQSQSVSVELSERDGKTQTCFVLSSWIRRIWIFLRPIVVFLLRWRHRWQCANLSFTA